VPELPEAETIVRGVRPAVTGRTVERIHVLRPDVLRTPARRFRHQVRGRTVHEVLRRGKNVILGLGAGDVVAINLGMTGRVLPFPEAPRGRRRPTHPAVRFYFHDGSLLVFDDQRRFGSVEFLDAEGWAVRDSRMGPEPLSPDFTAGDLLDALSRSRSPIRSWLLDQKRIAGVGNIYAAEALFLAGIHPQRPARSVSEGEARKLHGSLRLTLRGAIEAGGTTIRDYRNADGGEGRYARRLQVYGRNGEPCHVCGTVVERTVFGNRSAFFCPRCQGDGVATP
jgi:formamidopyrimidine-DNA glycosylase